MTIARLVVERGDPFARGTCLPLAAERLILGRNTGLFSPDIAFDSRLVSRKHCCLERLDGSWTIRELGSRHGTVLNGNPLSQEHAYPLGPGDKIGLAANVVVLRYSLADESEQTLDFDETVSLPIVPAPPRQPPVAVDEARSLLLVDGAEVALSAKEWLLLALLYKAREQLVAYPVIRRTVWAERSLLPDGTPDVGYEEMNVLIYRLRRKLGAHGGLLATRRGQGCILKVR